MTHSQVTSEIHHIVSSAFQSVSAVAGTAPWLPGGDGGAAPPAAAWPGKGCRGTAFPPWFPVARPWGRAAWHLPHCTAVQARLCPTAGALGKAELTVPGRRVPLRQVLPGRVGPGPPALLVPLACPRRAWCQRCQRCTPVGSWGCQGAELMINPLRRAARLPGAVGRVPIAAHVTGDGTCGPFLAALPPMDFLLGYRVSRSLTRAARLAGPSSCRHLAGGTHPHLSRGRSWARWSHGHPAGKGVCQGAQGRRASPWDGERGGEQLSPTDRWPGLPGQGAHGDVGTRSRQAGDEAGSARGSWVSPGAGSACGRWGLEEPGHGGGRDARRGHGVGSGWGVQSHFGEIGRASCRERV